jgi:hypothetical protein
MTSSIRGRIKMALNVPPYFPIGNPMMVINPYIHPGTYYSLPDDKKWDAEIFDMTDVRFPSNKVVYLPGPWFWWTA